MERDGERVTYYRLEVVARMCGFTPSGLRRLERAGLVCPARRVGNTYLYGEREVVLLRKIRRLRADLGVNLAGVAVILRLTEELAEARAAARQAQVKRPQPAESEE
ncbi:MAG: MerR family transcriptional regulator [Dehalococcoidales bacterium]|nr:MerR family transcriptional regulator [Dehalococcoidales bacterium]